MSNAAGTNLTQMLAAVERGEPAAAAELLPVVYGELRKLAAGYLANSPPGNTLQPTALVHEAWLRLVGTTDPGWSGRGHFFAAAAQAMRQILVDHARSKASLKRGGHAQRVALVDLVAAFDASTDDVLALNAALDRLEREDARKHRIIMLRFFAGLTAEQTAAALRLSLATVEREWRFARAWLRTEMGEEV
jgi:RNA polymerase sigma factor (TIGR02999 family)